MADLRLDCPSGTSDTGAYRLSWNGPSEVVFRLEENGTVLYEGPEVATTVSGRAPDEYLYRVGILEEGGETVRAWSQTCAVRVSPPPFTLALGLFGVGLVVFASLLVVVVRGHRAHRSGRIG